MSFPFFLGNMIEVPAPAAEIPRYQAVDDSTGRSADSRSRNMAAIAGGR
jgi:hypothetical protein